MGGNEELGLATETLNEIHTHIVVPMRGAESLNVAETASVVLTELKRCQTMHENGELLLWPYVKQEAEFVPRFHVPYPSGRDEKEVGTPYRWQHKMKTLEKAVSKMQGGLIVVLANPNGESLRTIRTMSGFGVSELHIIGNDMEELFKGKEKGKKFGQRYVFMQDFPNLTDSLQHCRSRGYSTVLCCSSTSMSLASAEDVDNIFKVDLDAFSQIALVFASEESCQKVALDVDHKISLPRVPLEIMTDQSF